VRYDLAALQAPTGTRRLYVEAQGHLFKVRASGLSLYVGRGGRRGEVREFSRASRKRMLETLARLTPKQARGFRGVGQFVTLTYAGAEADLPKPDVCKHDLDVFCKRVRRHYPGASIVWRIEFESSGARTYHPHFHLLVFGVPWLSKAWVLAAWNDCTGNPADAPSTRVEAIETWRGALAYAAKYAGKLPDASGLVYTAYLTEGTGRCWGVVGRDCLPWGEKIERSVELTDLRALYQLKRAARHCWRWVNWALGRGFTLFRENPGEWVSLAAYFIIEGGAACGS
jgi:hypothetical protein